MIQTIPWVEGIPHLQNVHIYKSVAIQVRKSNIYTYFIMSKAIKFYLSRVHMKQLKKHSKQKSLCHAGKNCYYKYFHSSHGSTEYVNFCNRAKI